MNLDNDEFVQLHQRINQLEYDIKQDLGNLTLHIGVEIVSCIFGSIIIILIGVYIIIKN